MALSPADRLEIHDLCARYYVSTDEKDVPGFMECWADDDDITFESAFGTFRGRHAIRAFEDEHVHRGMAVGKRHIVANVVIREGTRPDQALVTTYLVVMEVVEAPRIVATAIYRGSIVEKTDKGWRFRHRAMEVDPGFQKTAAGQGAHT